MDADTFDRIAARTRLRARARNMARRYLVDGETNASAVAREFDAHPQTVRDAVNRILAELRMEKGYPSGWRAVTVIVPPDTAGQIRDMAETAAREAGLQ